MAKAHIVAIAVLIAIFASWTVLGTAETIYDALSLMVLWRLSPAEKKTRNLVILALCVAVAWIDHFVIDFTFSSIFLLGRQWTLLWLNLSCLTFIRPRHEGQDDVAPAIPRIVRLSSMSLIVAVWAAGVIILQKSSLFLAVFGTAILCSLPGLIYTMSALLILSIRRKRSVLGYFAGSVLVAACCYLLLPHALRLGDVKQLLQTDERNPESSHFNSLQETLDSILKSTRIAAIYECLAHSDGKVRAKATEWLGYEMYTEIMKYDNARPDIFKGYVDGVNSTTQEGWWEHPAWNNPEPIPPLIKHAVPRLILLLEDDDAMVRIKAVKALGDALRWAAPAVPNLRQALHQHGDLEASRVDPNLILDDQHLIDLLNRMFAETSNVNPGLLRMSVAETIAMIGPGAVAAVPELITLLQDTIFPVRERAANALSRIGPPAVEAIPALKIASEDQFSTDKARAAAAFAVWSIERDDSFARKVLIKILETGTPDGKTEVAESLRYLSRFKGGSHVDWAIEPLIRLLETEQYREPYFNTLCFIGIESEAAATAITNLIVPDANHGKDESTEPMSLRSFIAEEGLLHFTLSARGSVATILAAAINSDDGELREVLLSYISSGSLNLNECDPQIRAAIQKEP